MGKKQQPAKELREEYETLLNTASRFKNEIVAQISAMVQSEDIHLAVPIESRVKKWDSISSKLDRLPLRVDSLKNLQDFVGVRIIVLFRRDAERLIRLISEKFKVLKSEDTSTRLREDQFGYLSTHMIVKVPDEWLKVPTMCSLGDLTAELQIRTLAQHMWAAASHVLQYKQEANVPMPVRRSIHRVSALLETIDIEFDGVLDARDKYRAQLRTDTSESLNADSLERLLDSLFPAKNKEGTENYSVMLKELSDFKIHTTDEVERLVKKHLRPALDEDSKFASEYLGLAWVPDSRKERMREKSVYFTHVGLLRTIMKLEFPDGWQEYMDKLAASAKARPRKAEKE